MLGVASVSDPPGTIQTNLTCQATDASSVLGSDSPTCNPLCASDLLVAFACLRLSLLIHKMGFGPEFGQYNSQPSLRHLVLSQLLADPNNETLPLPGKTNENSEDTSKSEEEKKKNLL